MAASGAAALGLAGCTTDEPASSSSAASASSSTATETTAPEPDRVALDRAVELTAGLIAGLAGANPVLDTGGRLAAIHEAHLAALQEAAGTTFTPLPSPPGRRLTAARLRRRELNAQRELARPRPGSRERSARAGVREHVRRHRSGPLAPGRGAPMRLHAVEALQTALAAEHAALYVYGFLGARTSESGQPLVFAEVGDAYAVHRAWRDLLTRRLLDEGAEPTPAAPTYERADDTGDRPRRDPGGGRPRGQLRRDLRLRRREHDGPGPPVGHRRADEGSHPAGGVRRASGCLPGSARPRLRAKGTAARKPPAAEELPRHSSTPGSRGPRWGALTS